MVELIYHENSKFIGELAPLIFQQSTPHFKVDHSCLREETKFENLNFISHTPTTYVDEPKTIQSRSKCQYIYNKNLDIVQ
jgi:hypothetical protein